MRDLPYSQLINEGIKNLSSLQEKDGSFVSYISTDEHDFSNATIYSTTFLSLIIFLLTEYLPSTKGIITLRKKMASFSLSQKSNYWSWNYLKRNSEEEKTSPYPDDLDDSFCALAALTQYDQKIITGDVFAHIVKLLTFTEKKEGGPYRTWLVKKSSAKGWMDIDIAVNSNVAYFLSLHDIILPNLEKYFEKAIKNKKLLSPYYPSFYAPCFFLSRFYAGKHKDQIVELFLKAKSKDGSFENPLKTGLAIITLLNFGIDSKRLKKSVQYLLQTQKNGLWPAYGFCINQIKNKTHYFAGSPALTTIICLVALQKYQLAVQKRKIEERFYIDDKEKSDLFRAVTRKTQEYFSFFDKEIYEMGNLLLQRIFKRDTSLQISLLPYYFLKSLKKKNKKISKSVLTKLGMANVLGWIAYTIFDDFLDDEGVPILLPLATIALRQLTYIFDTFPLQRKKVQKLFHIIMNKIDAANVWELKNCRIKNGNTVHKNFEQLANKSIGHALGPLTILLISGYKGESKEFKHIYSFFTHYLVTKQLNDDAHDWEKDLKKGHLTPVLSLLLEKAEEKNIMKNHKYLYELFWFETIQDIWKLIHFHARKARTALRKSLVFEDTKVLESLLEAHVKSADKALEEQKNVIAFLKTYKLKQL